MAKVLVTAKVCCGRDGMFGVFLDVPEEFVRG